MSERPPKNDKVNSPWLLRENINPLYFLSISILYLLEPTRIFINICLNKGYQILTLGEGYLQKTFFGGQYGDIKYFFLFLFILWCGWFIREQIVSILKNEIKSTINKNLVSIFYYILIFSCVLYLAFCFLIYLHGVFIEDDIMEFFQKL